MRTPTLALLLAVTPAWGCVSNRSPHADGSESAGNRITLEQLEGWTTPEIFVNGVPFGSWESLYQIGVETIRGAPSTERRIAAVMGNLRD